MFTEIVKDSIGVASAAIALATAWISYRAAKKKAVANREATVKVRKIEDLGVRRRPWDMRRYKWLAAIGALPALVSGILYFDSRDPALPLINIAIGLSLIAIIAFVRTEPPSRTKKSTRLELELPVETVLQACLKAASDMGAQIAEYDIALGSLIAKTGMSWRSFGEIVIVKAQPLESGGCEVRIESDVLQVTVFYDCGVNRRNIRRLQSALFSAGSPV